MEGSVNSEMYKKSNKSERPRKVEFSNGADAMGLWFAALVLCAVLTAGVILYRIGNSDVVTASNDLPPAAAHAMAQRH
jgi:hypothetical protein